MARKNRDLAGFGDVAENNVNENSNVNININKDDHIIDNDNSEDILDKIIEGTTKKEAPKLTGVYLDKDVLKVLNAIAKKGGRGVKSKIVNEALRKVFTDKGLL
jgi:vacuolar-type H+-ATPase subunit E/Vma4